ncbi:hypothetical protein WJX72_010124 [[Myrmecia] bisecta]|uniref:Uncharacterized protein n=1 Tax=[Myrmecia] bisecta TaxID=41462 RepID=A0AAW1QGD9_9CHLO
MSLEDGTPNAWWLTHGFKCEKRDVWVPNCVKDLWDIEVNGWKPGLYKPKWAGSKASTQVSSGTGPAGKTKGPGKESGSSVPAANKKRKYKKSGYAIFAANIRAKVKGIELQAQAPILRRLGIHPIVMNACIAMH